MTAPTPRSIRLDAGQLTRIKRIADATTGSEASVMRWALEVGLRALELELGQATMPGPDTRGDSTDDTGD